jgi:DNA-binding Lrp family transcriptional regulator
MERYGRDETPALYSPPGLVVRPSSAQEVSALLTLASAEPTADDQVVAAAREIPEVRALYRVTGSETYLLEVVVRVVHDLERVLRPFWRFGATTTGAVMSTPVFHPAITREMVEAVDLSVSAGSATPL